MKTISVQEIKQKLEQFSKLQSMPQVILRIKKISEDPKSTPADLTNCILSDHQLTSRVLRLANSAHYGAFAGKITTVTKALLLVGSRAVRNLAISMGVFQIVNNMSKESKFNLISFWTRSLGCGIIAKHLAHCLNQPKLVEEAFIGGFMHDIGQAILAIIFPNEYQEISKLDSEAERLEIYKTERAILGIDHMRAGKYMAQRWNLPQNLAAVISEHHLDITSAKLKGGGQLAGKICLPGRPAISIRYKCRHL